MGVFSSVIFLLLAINTLGEKQNYDYKNVYDLVKSCSNLFSPITFLKIGIYKDIGIENESSSMFFI